jgi:hypothetical protein
VPLLACVRREVRSLDPSVEGLFVRGILKAVVNEVGPPLQCLLYAQRGRRRNARHAYAGRWNERGPISLHNAIDAKFEGCLAL